jgi:hypothetical protein
VGAGGAVTGGVNKLPPVGLISFSVGDGETSVGEGLGDGELEDDVMVVVVVVVDDGDC